MLRTTNQSAASPSHLATGSDDCGACGPEHRVTVLWALLADSDRLQSGFLATLLTGRGFGAVTEVRTAKEAIAAAERTDPTLILVGALPDGTVLDLVRTLSTSHPTAVILIVGDLTEAETLEMLSAGGRGVISKQLDPEAFAAVIGAATSGRAVLVPSEVSAALARAQPCATDPSLSRRELEVLTLLARGRANASIAAELHISPSTAKGHVSQILRKLESENRLDAAVQGIRRGLVQP
jgi:DNA-binding NarL/FixJ family response regulator